MKTVKILFMFIAVSMLGYSCSSNSDDNGNSGNGGSGKLELSVSTSLIQADGTDAAQLSVLYDGKPVTEGVEIYDAATSKLVDLPSLRFTTTTAGKYSFWASYKTEKSNIVNVEAVDQPIPELPVDPNPLSTDFKRRVMFIQFTGNTCGYCPYMINALRIALEKPEYASQIIHAAIHSYDKKDPACPSNYVSLNTAYKVASFPQANIDMHSVFKNINAAMQTPLEKAIDAEIARTVAKAGIAVNSELTGNTLIVRVSVKAAATDVFRVGAWLLEDGIYAKQANYDKLSGDYDTHENCLRISDSQFSKNNYTGLFLGSINEGEIAEKVFVMEIEDGWVKENLHLTVFVTTAEGNGFYVNNVVDVPIGEKLAYDYK